MKLFLMRHADTELTNIYSDFDRVLTELGRNEAAQAANFLRQYQIDKIIVSYVKRTLQTVNIIQHKCLVSEVEIITELYNGNEEDIFKIIRRQKDQDKHILIIGHNPLIYTLSLDLSLENLQYDQLVQSTMPTAKIVVIDFQDISSWRDIKKASGTIIQTFTPDF